MGSHLEWEAEQLLRLSGVEKPVREHPFAKAAGRRWRFDFAWVDALVALEVEGGTWAGGAHTRGRGFAEDAEKYNEAALMGWLVIRVDSKQVSSGEAVAWVRRALALRKGSPR